MFKVNLFVHSSGRRLDQRIRRMLAVVSLPSQRSVWPGETTARRVAYKRPFIDFSPSIMSAELAVEFSRLGRSLS